MTLEALAAATGFTRGYLSKIENAKKIPPIGSLQRIAQALHADLAGFFQTEPSDAADERVSLVRVSERRSVVRGGTAFGYDYVSLAYKIRNKHIEPFIFTFPADINKDVSFEHEGEEVLFLLSGRVEFEIGGKTWSLETGDTLFFDASLPHRGRSIGGEARALVVIYRPDSKARP